jgi:hypothetical protein
MVPHGADNRSVPEDAVWSDVGIHDDRRAPALGATRT